LHHSEPDFEFPEVCGSLVSEMQTYFDEIRKPEFSKISFGKETIWGMKMSFSLNGNFPDFVVGKLSVLPETGLLSFINRTYGIHFSSFADATLEKNIDKPGMDGNVVIIFVALLIGLSLALSSFIIEMRRSIWSILLYLVVLFSSYMLSVLKRTQAWLHYFKCPCVGYSLHRGVAIKWKSSSRD